MKTKTKTKIIVSIICIIVIIIFATNIKGLLSENINNINITFEESVSGNTIYSFDILETENNIAIFSLLKNEKGLYVNKPISDFFLAQNHFLQNDGVITIYTPDESISIYSSGMIWSISDSKYVYLDLFNNKKHVRLLYDKLYDLISVNKN